MNPLENVKRMPSKRVLEDDGDDDNRPKERKIKQIQLNTIYVNQSISKTHDRWNSQSAYDKICKEFGFIRKFIALLITIFKTDMIESSCDEKPS